MVKLTKDLAIINKQLRKLCITYETKVKLVELQKEIDSKTEQLTNIQIKIDLLNTQINQLNTPYKLNKIT